MISQSISVSIDKSGLRLDQFLALSFPEYSRTYWQKAISSQKILVNNNSTKSRYLVVDKDIISIDIEPESSSSPPAGEDIPLSIVYEDKDIIAINKQAGLVVHPGAGNPTGTLVNAIIHYLPAIVQVFGNEKGPFSKRPGIAHRLDKNTSGIIIVTKNPRALRSISKQIQNRTVRKVYLALCVGRFKQDRGTIVNMLGRHPANRKKITDIGPTRGKEAITDYRIIREYQFRNDTISLVEFDIKTGRTHQIRAQVSIICHPILGDTEYGNKKSLNISKALNTERQMLHAQSISFHLPGQTTRSTFEAPLPADFSSALTQLSPIV